MSKAASADKQKSTPKQNQLRKHPGQRDQQRIPTSEKAVSQGHPKGMRSLPKSRGK
jgi:hypothetical protein